MKKIISSIIIFALLLFVGYGVVNAEDRTAKLTIENIQNSNENIEYTYEIHIENVRGAVETITNKGTEYLVFDSLGYLTFKLKGNESIAFNSLPNGAAFDITIEDVKDYSIKINDLELNKYNGTLDGMTKVTVTSFTNKNTGIVDDSKNPSDGVSKNPSTSDKIALVSMLCFITMLVSYVLIKSKRIKKYEDD